MSYQLTATTGDTAHADTIAEITKTARRILVANAGNGMTSIHITTPKGLEYPFGRRLDQDTEPAAIKYAVDELIYDIRATMHLRCRRTTRQMKSSRLPEHVDPSW